MLNGGFRCSGDLRVLVAFVYGTQTLCEAIRWRKPSMEAAESDHRTHLRWKRTMIRDPYLIFSEILEIFEMLRCE